jgi:hypothetical protein
MGTYRKREKKKENRIYICGWGGGGKYAEYAGYAAFMASLPSPRNAP